MSNKDEYFSNSRPNVASRCHNFVTTSFPRLSEIENEGEIIVFDCPSISSCGGIGMDQRTTLIAILAI